MIGVLWNDGTRHVTERVNSERNEFPVGILVGCVGVFIARKKLYPGVRSFQSVESMCRSALELQKLLRGMEEFIWLTWIVTLVRI